MHSHLPPSWSELPHTPRARPWEQELLTKLVEPQLGLVRREQLLQCGISRNQIQWRVRRRCWRRVLPHVYATFSGALSNSQKLCAAALYAGALSQITGAAALCFYGVRYVPPARVIDVLVSAVMKARSYDFVRTHRTHRQDVHARHQQVFEICSIPRSLADFARWNGDLRVIRAVTADVVQRQMTSVSSLENELKAGPRRYSALLRTVIAELSAGVGSAPEAELRKLLRASHILPVVQWNPSLSSPDGNRLPTPDSWIPDVCIAIEVDSHEFHLSPDQWEQDMQRHNVLARHRILVLHFTPGHIRRNAAQVLRTVEAAYHHRIRR